MDLFLVKESSQLEKKIQWKKGFPKMAHVELMAYLARSGPEI